MAIEVVDQAQPGVQVDRRATSAGPSQTPKAIPERAANIVPTVGECDVLVESTLVAPIGLKTQPFAAEWRLVKGKRVREIERELRASGWHLFYVIPDANGTGIARRPEDAVRKAFAKVFRKAFEHLMPLVPTHFAPEGASRCRAGASGLVGPVGGSKSFLLRERAETRQGPGRSQGDAGGGRVSG